MSRLIVDLPDSTLAALGSDPLHAGDELRLAAAMKYYELGRLSAGAAAELAGIPVPVFLSRLAEFEIPAFRQNLEELQAELRDA